VFTLPEALSLTSIVLAVLIVVVVLRVVYLVTARFIRPQLVIEDVIGADGKPNALVSGIVRSEIYRLQDEGAGAGLSFVSGNDQPISLPAEITVPDPVKWIAGVASWFPGRRSTLSATVSGPTVRGYAMTVALKDSSLRVGATATLWEHDFFVDLAAGPTDIAERQFRLALATASWAMYRVMERAGIQSRLRLITQDWESYALFLVASRLQMTGRNTEAQRVYAKALDRDARNRGALFNIGVLDLVELEFQTAIDRFSAVLRDLQSDALERVSPHEFDRLWYRAVYNRGAAELSRRSTDKAELAMADLLAAARTAHQALELLGGDAQMLLGGQHADLARFLVVTRNSALAAYADAAQPLDVAA
jgi:hypothetical protein